MVFQSATRDASSGPKLPVPWAVTRRSSRPNARMVAATAPAAVASWLASPAITRAWPPPVWISSAPSSRPARPRARLARRAPSAASAPAIARPIPRLPPETRTTRPVSLIQPGTNPCPVQPERRRPAHTRTGCSRFPPGSRARTAPGAEPPSRSKKARARFSPVLTRPCSAGTSRPRSRRSTRSRTAVRMVSSRTAASMPFSSTGPRTVTSRL